MPHDANKLLAELGAIRDPAPALSRQEQDRILRRALEKAGLPAPATPAEPTPPLRVAGHRRGLHRALSLAAAVAVVGGLSVTAFAVGPQLIRMLRGKVAFFEEAPAQSQVDNALDAPRGSYEGAQQEIEAYNAPVGQSVTSNGVTVTLDNIAMDGATMDVFFTITGQDAIAAVLDSDSYLPDWGKLFGVGPDFWRATVNGQEILDRINGDYYRQDDGTLKLWQHFVLTEMPQGDTLTIAMQANRALNVEGDWSFSVTLDGSSVRSGTRQAAPGVYEMGQKTFPNSAVAQGLVTADQVQDRPLRLTNLAFGPLGGSISTSSNYQEVETAQGTVCYTDGMGADEFYITDDTGKELYLTRDPSYGANSQYSLTLPDPAATSVTLTPVLTEEGAGEEKQVTAEELKQGVQLATSELGGYTVQNYRLEGSTITMELVPYGWPGRIELIPEDEGLISMATSQAVDADTGETFTAYHSALRSETSDPTTGVITLRMDYYAATEEELATVTTYHYHCNSGYRLDTDHALTLPLEPVE